MLHLINEINTCNIHRAQFFQVNLLELQNDMGSFNASVRRMIGLLLSSKLQTQFNRTGSKQKLSFAKCLEPLLKGKLLNVIYVQIVHYT